MKFSELSKGDRFKCRLPGIRSPVECVKLSRTRFRVIGGQYHKTQTTEFPVSLIPKLPD